MSQLQHVTTTYRSHLLATEARAEQSLRTAHTHTLASIQPHLDTLYRDIEQKHQEVTAEDDTARIPLSWLFEQNRLPNVTQHVENAVNQFGQFTQTTVTQLSHQGQALGQQAAQAQLEAVSATPVKTPHPAPLIEHVAQAGSRLASLTSGYGAEAAKGVKTALIRGLALGSKVKQIAGEVTQALVRPLQRAIVTAGDFLVDAYRGVVGALYRANDNVAIGWAWICDLTGNLCCACLAMQGSIHPLDEDLESHERCRCQQQIITANSPEVQSGADWLDSQDEETQREVLGAKYNGWASGDFSLDDMVGHEDSPVWGKSIYEKPLKALVK